MGYRKQIRKMASSKRTLFAFASMILFMVVLGVYALFQIQQSHNDIDKLYKHPFVVSNAVREINTHIVSMHRHMKDVASAQSDHEMQGAIEQVNADEQQALRQFSLVLDRFLGEKTEIQEMQLFFINWKPIRDEVINLARTGYQPQALAITKGKGADYVIQMEAKMDSLIRFANNKASEFYQNSSSRVDRSEIVLISLMSVVLLLSVSIAVYVIRLQRKAQERDSRHLQQLAKSELKYRELLEASPDAVLIVDKKRRIQIVNSQAIKMFGYSSEELIGQAVELLIPVPQVDQHREMATHYIENQSVEPKSPRRLCAMKKDGSEFPVSVSLSPVTIAGELFITSAVRDMTQQEEVEKNLRQAQKMESVGTLVGGIAHDFNNLLAAISGSIYLVRRDLEIKDNKHLDVVESECRRAADIVKQLLAFARKDVVQVQSLSLRDLFLESTRLLQFAASENIPLNMDISEESLMIRGDHSQLQQVILNLINNARDALVYNENPDITVSLQRFHADEGFLKQHSQLPGEEFAHIIVRDNGTGIAAEDLEHIFEPFFTTKEVGQGTGLGLAMLDGTIKTHRGAIVVESSSGTGTAFHIYLPLIDVIPEEIAGVRSEPTLHKGDGELILIVDDEENIRVITRGLLKSIGYQSIEAADGREAIAMFQQHHLDIKLVITDVVMPVMGGIKAAEGMRKIAPDTPILFATGYDQSQVLRDIEINDLTRVVTKPYSLIVLSQMIKVLIGK